MAELFVAVVIWGFSFALSKRALNQFSPIELVGLRLWLGALSSFAIVRLKKPKTDFKFSFFRQRSPWILGLLEFAGTYIFYTWSLLYLPSGVVGALTLLTPAFTFVVGCLLGVAGFSWRGVGATLLSFMGASLCLPSAQALLELRLDQQAATGVLLIVISNLLFALGNAFISKWEMNGKNDRTLTPTALACGALVVTVLNFFSPHRPLAQYSDLKIWLLPFYLGVVATGVGFYLWNRGVQKTSAFPASLVGNFKGPLAVVWGIVLLNEKFTLKFFLGLGLLYGATQMLSFKNGRRESVT